MGGVTVVGADRNLDGIPDYLQYGAAPPLAAARVGGSTVIGADRNFDGVPDVLQSIPPSPLAAPAQFYPGSAPLGQVQYAPGSPYASGVLQDEKKVPEPADIINMATKESERAAAMVKTL